MLVVERKCDAAPSRFTIVNECKNGLVSSSLGVTTERDQQQKELRNEKREKKQHHMIYQVPKIKMGVNTLKTRGEKSVGNRVERRQTCQVPNGERDRVEKREGKGVDFRAQVTRQSSDKVEQLLFCFLSIYNAEIRLLLFSRIGNYRVRHWMKKPTVGWREPDREPIVNLWEGEKPVIKVQEHDAGTDKPLTRRL